MTVFLVAWGVLAFGGVYSWAYWPLVAGAAMTGVLGLFGRSINARRFPLKTLFLSIGFVALAVVFQVLPLPRSLLLRVSPVTDALVQKQNLSYALALATDQAPRGWATHSLSLDPASTVRCLLFLTAFAVLFAGLSRALNFKRLQLLSQRIVTLGLFVALIAVVQRATVGGARIYGFWTPLQGTSPYGPFVNKNHFAGWMVMVLALAVGVVSASIARGMRDVKADWRHRLLWLSSGDANHLIFTIFATVIMGVALVLSFSRSGIAALGVAILVMTWLIVNSQVSASRRLITSSYLVVVAMVALGTAGLDAVVNRFSNASWTTMGDRLGAWMDTIRMVRDFPLTGIGLNAFSTGMLEYQTVVVTPPAHFAQAHNDYLQLAAEGGLLVGIPIVITAVLFIREIRQRFRESADDVTTYWIRVGATIGLIAIAVQEFVEFSLQMPGNALLFTVLAAIAVHHPEGGRRRAV